jgi:hypothetical protein
MVLLRYVSLVSLGLWIGGLVALGGIATPSLFEILRAALGPRPPRFAIRAWAAVLMLGATMAVGFYIAPRIEAIRDHVKGPVAALPETDPRRVEFARLHGLSTGLLLVPVVGGLGLLWLEMKDSH